MKSRPSHVERTSSLRLPHLLGFLRLSVIAWAQERGPSKLSGKLLNDWTFVLTWNQARGAWGFTVVSSLVGSAQSLQFIEAGCAFTNVGEGQRRLIIFATGRERFKKIMPHAPDALRIRKVPTYHGLKCSRQFRFPVHCAALFSQTNLVCLSRIPRSMYCVDQNLRPRAAGNQYEKSSPRMRHVAVSWPCIDRGDGGFTYAILP